MDCAGLSPTLAMSVAGLLVVSQRWWRTCAVYIVGQMTGLNVDSDWINAAVNPLLNWFLAGLSGRVSNSTTPSSTYNSHQINL